MGLPLIVGEHGPEPTQGLGGNAWPELGNVAFEVRADEGEAPVEAVRVALGEVALWETASAPELAKLTDRHFASIDGMQLAVSDAAGQRLARLL